MSLEFGQCVAYTTITDGKWARCNDHWIEAGTTYRGVLDSLEKRFPNSQFAEIAWEIPKGVIWMDDVLPADFADNRYNLKYQRNPEQMESFKMMLS